MTRKHKTYTEDFKQESVTLALKSESICRTAKDLEIPEATLYGWIKNATSHTTKHKIQESKLDLHEELKKLCKENARLREDGEILKKAAAYFAKEIK